MMRFSPLLAVGALVALIAGTSTIDSDENLDARRKRIQSLTPVQKDDLLRKKERFDHLSREDQDRLRSLHEALASDPEAKRLKDVMVRYTHWLRTLSPRERAMLADLPAEERVQRVAKIMADQDAEQFRLMTEGKLSPKDRLVINTWLNEFVEAREAEILSALPPPQAQWIKDVDDPERRRRFLATTLFSRRSPERQLPGPTQDEILTALAPRLSREAQKFLERLADNDERDRIARVWIRAAVFSRMPRPISPEKVGEMLAELNSDQREYLESLPRDRMYAELQRIYFSQRFGTRGPRFGTGGRGGGPPSGAGGRRGGSDDERRRGGRGGSEERRNRSTGRKGDPNPDKHPTATPPAPDR